MEESDVEWREHLREWLEARGYVLIERDMLEGELEALGGATWIAGGPSERGTDHAVVYRGSHLLHDPHVSRAGLLEVTDALVLASPA